MIYMRHEAIYEILVSTFNFKFCVLCPSEQLQLFHWPTHVELLYVLFQSKMGLCEYATTRRIARVDIQSLSLSVQYKQTKQVIASRVLAIVDFRLWNCLLHDRTA